MPCNEETFDAVIHNPEVRAKVLKCHELYKEGKKQEYAALKKELPMFIFMATFEKNNGKKGTRNEGTWRLQSAARLNGLVMLDYDHLGRDPREVFASIPEHMFDDDCANQVLFAHPTPSSDGLRLVCKADPQRGDILANQQWISRILHLECDESVHNADRTSFAVPAEEIYYLDKQLFTYENEEFDKLYGENYRRGVSKPDKVSNRNAAANDDVASRAGNVQGNAQPEQAAAQVNLEKDAEGDFCYNGDKFKTIIERWLKENGNPQVGARHLSALKLASDLRYFCDNNAENIKAIIVLAPFVQDMINEGAQEEIDNICTDVVERKMNINLPRKLQSIASAGSATAERAAEEQKLMAKYAEFWNRLKPLMTEIYDLPTYRMEDYNKLGGVFIAGAMYCTLLTRCWYKHYDGEDQRMNPQVYIIGDPASGKGEAEKIDQAIMAPVIIADKAGREAEKEYKRQQKERSTSTKAQKGEALKRPEFPIRYLPSKTSNAVFYRRQLNAVEEIKGEKFPLHLYTFDSELDSNTAAQSSGNWIGKHDIELKAFHNEFTGVDFANNDSVNDLMQIFYNSVCTGTPLSLHRKVNPRNVNDGLCSRMAIFRMVSENFTMISKGNKNLIHEKRCKLKEWAFKFDKIGGEMPIRKLVDHVYKLCEQTAEEAGLEDDKVLDYLRKRAVFYATWFTVPRIMERAVRSLSPDPASPPTPLSKGRGGSLRLERGGDTSKAEGSAEWSAEVMKMMKVEKSDLEFATLIYDAVLFWQDYYFGRMLQNSWDDAARDQKPRHYKSKNAQYFESLPKEFNLNELEKIAGITNQAARNTCLRWMANGYIKRKKVGWYEKLIAQLEV